MRTFIGTYKINGHNYNDEYLEKYSTINSNKYIKYKFINDKECVICYLTLIAKNRLHLRKLKRDSLSVIKNIGKVSLIVSVG